MSYYLWRFGWVFYIMGFFFTVMAFFAGFLSFLRIGSGIAGLLTAFALFWFSLAAALMTYVPLHPRVQHLHC